MTDSNVHVVEDEHKSENIQHFHINWKKIVCLTSLFYVAITVIVVGAMMITKRKNDNDNPTHETWNSIPCFVKEYKNASIQFVCPYGVQICTDCQFFICKYDEGENVSNICNNVRLFFVESTDRECVKMVGQKMRDCRFNVDEQYFSDYNLASKDSRQYSGDIFGWIVFIIFGIFLLFLFCVFVCANEQK